MTEAEWLAGEDLRALLDYLHGQKKIGRGPARSRKYRLFSCSCVRRTWENRGEQDRQAVEWSEQYADGMAPRAAMPATWPDLHAAVRYAVYCDPGMASHDVANVAYFGASSKGESGSPAYHAERRHHAMLLREIMGNPFAPITVVPVWLTPTVMQVALVAYVERELPSGHLDTASLAVLSDALEDAGCADADLLGHLRSSGPHVRGCWALDLILGMQ